MRIYSARMTVLLVTIASMVGGCASATSDISMPQRDAHERLNGVLWMQTAAEYEVLTRTLYRQATRALDQAKADPEWTAALEQTHDYQKLPPAIVIDVDETVLDNSPYNGWLIKRRRDFEYDTWTKWAKLAAAKPIPGAVEFLQYANSQGVRILYVTNRDHGVESATRKNLEELGLPLTTTTDAVLTKNEPPHHWSGDKTGRRALVAKDYRILLLIGDDLGDFVSGANSDPASRRRLADKYSERWGVSWFLLPNPLYGSWERALYERAQTDQQALQQKLERVKDFSAEF